MRAGRAAHQPHRRSTRDAVLPAGNPPAGSNRQQPGAGLSLTRERARATSTWPPCEPFRGRRTWPLGTGSVPGPWTGRVRWSGVPCAWALCSAVTRIQGGQTAMSRPAGCRSVALAHEMRCGNQVVRWRTGTEWTRCCSAYSAALFGGLRRGERGGTNLAARWRRKIFERQSAGVVGGVETSRGTFCERERLWVTRVTATIANGTLFIMSSVS